VSFHSESERLIDATQFTTEQWKEESEFRLKERLADLQFRRDEVFLQRKTAKLEEEALMVYKQRLIAGLEYLRADATRVCQQCQAVRNIRLGVELVNDAVDQELRQEIKTINGCVELILRILDEVAEQLRRIRAEIYLLDRDLYNKDRSITIDDNNLQLKETQSNLQLYWGQVALDPYNNTDAEWTELTAKNIANTARELTAAAQMRSYIDILLKQVIDDLETQINRTNQAFQSRITETKATKTQLENLHHATAKQINEMTRTITSLEKALADKEGYVALTQTRLVNRAQRPGLELCKDAVQDTLMTELHTQEATVGQLHEMLAQAKATLRYLLNTQQQQTEEINLKMNTLRIDEADCMVMRQSLSFKKL
jgi:tektin-1